MITGCVAGRTSLLAGRTCSSPEHPWVAASTKWDGGYESIDDDRQPFPMDNAEDPFMWLDRLSIVPCPSCPALPIVPCPAHMGVHPFMWLDRRGSFHMIHHWQSGQHNRYFNGGHSFSRDGSNWTFSPVPSYTKNISWTDGSWTVMGRRERPGLLLADAGLPGEQRSTPLVLFTSVAAPGSSYGSKKGASWLQSQPIRQTAATGGETQGGGACQTDESCNLNGRCKAGKCLCDHQWDGATCGILALLPAAKDGGYRRPGFNGWGALPQHCLNIFEQACTGGEREW